MRAADRDWSPRRCARRSASASTRPTRKTSFDSSTRRSFGCSSSASSPSSSRKHGAAVGALEHAGAPLGGAGEGALLVPEQLRLDQRRRHRRAVEHDERPRRPPRARVQRPRHPLLAGAGLALDQDRRVGRRHALEQREQLAHRHRAAEQPLEVVVARRARTRTGAAVSEKRSRVAPHSMIAPSSSGATRTRTPPTRVPLVEPRSRSTQSRCLDVDAQVAPRHVRVGEHQIARRVRADLEATAASPARVLPASGPATTSTSKPRSSTATARLPTRQDGRGRLVESP